KALKVSFCSEQLLQRTEIAHRIIASLLWVSLPAKEFVLLDFARPDDGVSRRIRDAFDDGELWSGHSALVPPPNGLRTIAVASLRPLFVLTQPIVLVAQICKHIAGVVQDNVEDDVEALRMRCIDQCPKLVICILRGVCN